MYKVLCMLCLIISCNASEKKEESISDVLFENTPIAIIKDKYKRVKSILLNKKNKVKLTPNNNNKVKKIKKLKIQDYPMLPYKSYDAISSNYDTSSSCTFGSKLYLYGGSIQTYGSLDDSFKKLWIFNFKTKSWKGIKVPYKYRRSASVSYHDQKIYIYGGALLNPNSQESWHDNKIVNELLIYDFVTKIWSKKEIGTKRSDHSATIYKNKIYFYGGENRSKKLLDMEIYDIHKETLITTEFTSNRSNHKAIINKGVLYIIGGMIRDEDGFPNPRKSIEYINLKDEEKESINLPFSVWNHVVGFYNNYLIVYGGYRDDSSYNHINISYYSLKNHFWTNKRYKLKSQKLIVGGIYSHYIYLFGSVSNEKNIVMKVDLDKIFKDKTSIIKGE
ncbi:MAG: hypothetical protein COB02_18505 [Candidatus Cloacimonadota bacterium]|nr:MAG: hypothetical protein COB02_18505 [Candidatus Cloacimonadota bacterium]